MGVILLTSSKKKNLSVATEKWTTAWRNKPKLQLKFMQQTLKIS